MAAEPLIRELYEQVKGVVWVLKIEGLDREEEHMKVVFTAFAVHASGLLMTCAHGEWSTWAEPTISARPLSTRGFPYQADIVELRMNCDICILQLRGQVQLPQVAEFGPGGLDVGDKLFLIGHPERFVATGVLGSVVYPCVEHPHFNFNSTTTCENYICRARARTPTHRIMGHVWYNGYFDNGNENEYENENEDENQDHEFERNLLAKMPIIQISGLMGGPGSSGGPIFNTRGQVVGMMTSGTNGFDIGTHVSVLTRFLEMVIG